jgi:hypothetical protein
MTGRAFRYFLVFGATILAGIGFSRECARCAELPKPGLIHPAMSVTRVRGESIEPPRLAFHPHDAVRVVADQQGTPTKPLRREPGQRTGAGAARQGFARSTWMFAAGGVLVFVALILRYQVAHDAATQPASEVRTISTTTVLEALIANRLPIVEEALVLPHERQIFGRPLLESPYRRDRAHALEGPHFAIGPRRPAKAPAMADVTAPRAPGASPDRDHRVDQAHAPGGRGELDRALAALQGDQS